MYSCCLGDCCIELRIIGLAFPGSEIGSVKLLYRNHVVRTHNY